MTQVVPTGGRAMAVAGVGSNRFRHDGDRLVIELDSASKAGRAVGNLLYQYRRENRRSDSKYCGNKYAERCFFSANWPDLARQWLPTIDHPYDKATSEFLITAPVRYQVVANGCCWKK